MSKKLFIAFLILILSVVTIQSSIAQMTVNSSVTATQLAQALVGTGVQVSNAVLNCGNGGYGLFNVTGGNLGMQSGILLTNGSAVNAIGPNSLASISTNFTPSLPGDPDLNAILFPTPTADACSLEFDVFVSSDTLSFNYIFGSDEYPEFVSFWPVINDLFGLFISGPGIVGKQNIALVPNTATYVGINTVNCTVNGTQYVCNTPAGVPFGGVCATNCPSNNVGTVTEYDGFTKKLVAKKAVQRCNTYHLKIVIADGNDDVVDSGLFLEAASLTTSGVNVIASVDTTSSGAHYPKMVEGCKNGRFCFMRAGLNTDTSKVKFLILGSAVNGVDYPMIADSVVFYPGDSMFCLPITPVDDGVNEGDETVIIRIIYTSCSGTSYLGDSLILHIQDPLKISLPSDTIICTNPFSVHATASGSLPVPSLSCGQNASSSSGGPINYTVGTGNNNSALPSFLNGYYHDSRFLMVFSKNDLINAGASSGIIQNLAFNVTQYNSSYPYQNFTVKVACANNSNPTIPSNFISGLTTVFGPTNFTPTLGWNTINFNQGYDWDGTNGIYIEICYDDTIGSNSDVIQKSLTTQASVLYAYKDSTIGCALNFSAPNTIGSSSLRPNIRFGISNPAPTPFNYVWSPSANVLSGQNTSTANLTFNQPTALICQLTNIPGCFVADTTQVNYVNASALTITNDTLICPNLPISLSASGGIFYNWYTLNGSTLSCNNCSGPLLTVPQGGIKDSAVVVATMQGGCILRDTVFLQTINAPIANISIATPICTNVGTALSFTGSAGISAIYNWNFYGATFQNNGSTSSGPYTLSWNSAGTHFVDLLVSDSGCTSYRKDTISVLTNLPSNIVLSDDTICQGATLQVVETFNLSGANYLWNFGGANILSGSNAGPFNIVYQQSDSIQLTITKNGCSSIPVSKQVFVKPLPVASFTLHDLILCEGLTDTLQFTGSSNISGGPVTYAWSFGTASVNTIQNNTLYGLIWSNSTLADKQDSVQLIMTQDGCSSVPFKRFVTIHPIPVASLTLLNDTICENSNSLVDALGSNVNPSGGTVTYNWNFGGLNFLPSALNAGPYTISAGSTIDSISHFTISLGITQDACSSTSMDTLVLTILPQPSASFTVSNNPICSGVPVNFVFNGNLNSFNGGTPSYSWSFNGSSTVSGSGVGPYSVIYTNADTFSHAYYPQLTVTQNGCVSPVFVDTLNLYPIQAFTILATPNFCIGQTGYLYPSQNFSSYSWSTGSSNDSLLVQVSGHYVLTIIDKNGCVDSNSYDLNIKPAPHANAGSDLTIYAGNYVQLSGSNSYGGNQFSWAPAAYLSLSNVANPYAAPNVTTQFILSYSDTSNGCVDRDTMTIFVKECSDLIIPNAFSPNQDGVDDYFMIMNPEAIYKLSQLSIYNRWGQKVFETDDKMSLGWDGKLYGKDQEVGTYMYLIIADCGGGKQTKLKGNITLIR